MFFSFLLFACTPIIKTVPGYDPDLRNGFKTVQAYQKTETIGYTDVEQRKKDFFDCGGKEYREGNLDMNVVYSDFSIEEADARSKKMYACFKNKGYVYIGTQSCTQGGRDLGVCN